MCRAADLEFFALQRELRSLGSTFRPIGLSINVPELLELNFYSEVVERESREESTKRRGPPSEARCSISKWGEGGIYFV